MDLTQVEDLNDNNCISIMKFWINEIFSVIYKYNFLQLAPEEGPSSVECSGVTSTALRVSWQPIPPHKQAGALIGYTVLYAAHGNKFYIK